MRADVPPAQAILAGHWSPRNAGPEAAPLRPGDHSPRQSQHEKLLPSSYPILADAGSCPGNCSGMEEATGAPSSFAVSAPRRRRASSRDRGCPMNKPRSPISMLLSRHTRRREFVGGLVGAAVSPGTTFGQQPGGTPKVGILTGQPADDVQPYVAAVRRGLEEGGFVAPNTIQIEHRS